MITNMTNGKFNNLKDYLRRETRTSLYLSFEEIEDIIGQPLCPSAHKYIQYWNPTKTHTLAVMIYDLGFKIDPDLFSKRIKLIKDI